MRFDSLLIRSFVSQLTFLKVSQFFLTLFLLSFSFQIRTIIYTPSLYLTGNFDNFTTGFVFASELFLLVAFIAYGLSFYRKEQQWSLHFGDPKITGALLLFLTVVLATIFVAQDQFLHLLLSFRFLELFLFYIMMVNEVLPAKKVFFFFFLSMAFQALTAFYQYLVQGSLGLHFLGEPIATVQTLGVAKMDVAGMKILRAFGTFSHANVLGGALCIALILCFQRLSKQMWIYLPLILLLGTGFLFSFSRSAFFGLVIGFLVYISIDAHKTTLRAIVLFVSLLFLLMVLFGVEHIFFQRFLFEDSSALQERTAYLSASFQMLKAHPFGVGLGGFTLLMQYFSVDKFMPWIFQPVHNVFMMVANETGILGGVVFLGIFIVLFLSLIDAKKRVRSESERQYGAVLIALLFAIMTISLFDHYFFTLYSGQVLLFFYVALASSFVSKSLLPLKNSSIGSGFLPSN